MQTDVVRLSRSLSLTRVALDPPRRDREKKASAYQENALHLIRVIITSAKNHIIAALSTGF
jgi:hypothetical protein